MIIYIVFFIMYITRVAHKKNLSMFNFSRYLPLGRGNPETADEFGSPASSNTAGDLSSRPREIEMVPIQVQADSNSPSVFRARVTSLNPRDEIVEESFEELEDESASPVAIVAVRVCVWAFFLLGFLVLFHNQQEKFMADRSRQNGKLRSTQLLHIPVPWVESSAFTDTESCFVSHFLDSSAQSISIQRFMQDGKGSVFKRSNLLPMLSETTPASERIHQIQRIEGTSIHLKKVSETEYNFNYGKDSFSLKVKGDVAFFKFFPSSSTSLLVTRPRQSQSTDCLTRYNGETCMSSKPITRGNGYFHDDQSNVLVSVGTDSTTVDNAGNHLKGVFVQSINPEEATIDFSLTTPFINRFDEGLWAFQNAPQTNGFIVILPVIGFPPTPVQHLVPLLDLTGGVKKGSVLRMESEELRLFRKIDTLKYIPPELDGSICSC